MEYKDIDAWSHSLDLAAEQPLTADLPMDSPVGHIVDQIMDDIRRRWLRVQIVSGATGGRWAYWKSWIDGYGKAGIGPHPGFEAIADTLFNGDQPHFIGMLGTPYIKGGPSIFWILVEPRLQPPPPIVVYEEKTNPRYEKSKEVFDVQTHESKELS